MKVVYRYLTLLSSLLLSACQDLPVRNPLTGYMEPKLSELAEIKNPIALPYKLKALWADKVSIVKGYNRLNPLIVDDTVYFTDDKGYLKAINYATGKVVWRQKIQFNFSAGPTKVDDKLIFGSKNGQVLAFDIANGKQVWQAELNSLLLAPVDGANGVVVIKTVDGAVVALNAFDGQQIWRLEQSIPALTLRLHSAPKIVDDRVLLGMPSGKCMAVNLHSGYVEWERNITAINGRSELQRMKDISANLVVDNYITYIVTYQGKLVALNVNNGAIIWEKDMSGYQDMQIDGEVLYLTDASQQVLAIEAKSGITLWKQTELSGRDITGPTVTDKAIMVLDRQGFVHWLDKQNGSLVARNKISLVSPETPLKYNDFVLIKNKQGKLAAFSLV